MIATALIVSVALDAAYPDYPENIKNKLKGLLNRNKQNEQQTETTGSSEK